MQDVEFLQQEKSCNKQENRFGGGIVMKEDYVSFRNAKLLMEKGFAEPCIGFYDPKNECFFESCIRKVWDYNIHGSINAPTLQMAMRWLRELYDIHIVIFPSSFIYEDKYTYSIYQDMNKDKKYKLHLQSHEKTYEGAVNEALEDCLTNLISLYEKRGIKNNQ